MKKDGGPAFPCPWGCDAGGMHLPSDPKGMSLRDWFAGQALAGIVGHPSWTAETFAALKMGLREAESLAAQVAYLYADAMLARRNKE